MHGSWSDSRRGRARSGSDPACGTGAVAERAAAGGAQVTGIDLAPALIETARERAAELGLSIDYRVGDCERLDFPDESFDALSSTFGVMFAPDDEATARELARLTLYWRPPRARQLEPHRWCRADVQHDGAVEPVPPPTSPFDWGDEPTVRGLLGDSVHRPRATRVDASHGVGRGVPVAVRPASVHETLAESLGERRAELQRAWVDFFESNYRVGDEIAHTREYLLVLGE